LTFPVASSTAETLAELLLETYAQRAPGPSFTMCAVLPWGSKRAILF
jgi:hypothetical protein